MWNKILAEVLFVLIMSCILILAVGVVMTPFWSVGVLKDVMNKQIKIESQQREINNDLKKIHKEFGQTTFVIFDSLKDLKHSRHFSPKKKGRTFKEMHNPFYRGY